MSDDTTRQPAQTAPGSSTADPLRVNRLFSLAMDAAFKAPPSVPGYYSRLAGSYPAPQVADFMRDGLALLADMRDALGRERANAVWKVVGQQKPGPKKGAQRFPDIDQRMVEIYDSVRAGTERPEMQHQAREVIARAIATDVWASFKTGAGQSIEAITKRLVRAIAERDKAIAHATRISALLVPNALLGPAGSDIPRGRTKIAP